LATSWLDFCPPGEGIENLVQVARPSVTLENVGVDCAAQPVVGRAIDLNGLERPAREHGFGKIDPHRPPRVIERLDGDAEAVLPVAIAVSGVPVSSARRLDMPIGSPRDLATPGRPHPAGGRRLVDVRRWDDLPGAPVRARGLGIKPLGHPPAGRITRVGLGDVGHVGSDLTAGAAVEYHQDDRRARAVGATCRARSNPRRDEFRRLTT
jgi:hypothetical protein